MDKKERENLKVLFALVHGAKKSDRELAKILKISQPTVTRKRANLEKEGYIKGYTVIPDIAKLGFDFVAMTFLSFAEDRPELFDKAREWTKNKPCIIFAANGEGMAMNSVMISLHVNYASYSKLITELRRDWLPNLKDVQSFMISLARPEIRIKPFSLRDLDNLL